MAASKGFLSCITIKIGIFISHIMGFYQKNVCQGIIDKALVCFYGWGESRGLQSGRESILTLPNFDDLSSVIFLLS